MPDTKESVVRKLTALANDRFGGSRREMFKFYDHDLDGNIDRSELTEILYDADIGSGWTRNMYVRSIIEQLDTDKDGSVSWAEFDKYAR